MRFFWHYTNIGKRAYPQYLQYSILYAEQVLRDVPRMLELSLVDQFIYDGWMPLSQVAHLPHLCVALVDSAIYHKINEYQSIRICPGDSLYGLLGNDWERTYKHTLNDGFRKEHPNPNALPHGIFISLPDENRYPVEWIIRNTELFDVCRYLIHQRTRGDLLFVNSSCIYDLPRSSDQFVLNGINDISCFFCPAKYADQLLIRLKKEEAAKGKVGTLVYETCKKIGEVQLCRCCSASFSTIEDIPIN